jgi:hypothetical protein
MEIEAAHAPKKLFRKKILILLKCHFNVYRISGFNGVPLGKYREISHLCNRQHNGQKKKYKSTSNDQQNMHIKLKIE